MTDQTRPAEPAANYGTTRRHYSTNLIPASYGAPGKEGVSICRPAADVYDETAINAILAPYRQGKPLIVVADLPECMRCARALTKMGADRG